MQASLRLISLAGLAVLLSACPRPVRPPEAPSGVPPQAPADTRGAQLYDVNPGASEVDILVFRGGTLGRLGHNHVVTAKRLHGRVWIHPEFTRSGFELAFAVDDFVVDDPEARRAAGSEFPPDVPESDKEGTRRNMLKPEVLDAQRYPEVKVNSVRVSGTRAAPQITAQITIKSATRQVQVPAQVALAAGRLNATGEFEILQSDFGIEPFTAALGALAVQDRLRIRFRIVAERSS